jgi:hypothetical protein
MLIKLASGFEHVMKARRQPTFVATFPANPTGQGHDPDVKIDHQPQARPGSV